MKLYFTLLCLLLSPVYGLHNLLINGSSSPTLTTVDSLTITAEFEASGAVAEAKYYYDINGNRQLDPADPILISFRMIDGNFDDEDELQNGSYTFIDEPIPVTGQFLMYAEDNGVADTVPVTVNPVSSSYSISGTITEPSSQEHIMIIAMYYDTVTHYDYSFGDFTDASGDYTISIPDNLGNIWWNLMIWDWADVVPLYLGTMDSVYVSGDINKDLAMIPTLPDTCTLSGNITDEFDNPLGSSRVSSNVSGPTFFGLKPGLSDASGYYHLYVLGDVAFSNYSIETMDIIEQFYPDYMAPLRIDTTIMGQTPPYHIIIDIKAYTTTNTISGHVYIDGLPYDKAKLVAYADIGAMTTKSYSDGSYSLPVSDSLNGLYEVFVHDRSVPVGYYVLEGTQFVAAGSTNVDFYVVPVGIIESDNNIANKNIRIYPNPARSEIFFEIPNHDAEISIEIFDVSGRKIANINPEPQGGRFRVHLDDKNLNLPEGIYFYSLKLNEEVYRGKIIRLE